MEKKKNAEPKVFISYAWGTQEYQEKVIQFATRLQTEAGIEVIIDKWSMDVGNDTYAFMEKSVNDKTINFVLLLLDKNYKEKADERKGGVGTETQIISIEVYNNVEQTKFVPIIFGRDENGCFYKPTYLQSLLHFDLTQKNAEAEYIRLVRHLYGEETYPVPKKGIKPAWVDKTETIAVSFYSPLSFLDSEKNMKERRKIVAAILDELTQKVMAIGVPYIWDNSGAAIDPKPYLAAIEETKQYRDAYIDLVEKISGDDYFEDLLGDFIEKYDDEIIKTNDDHIKSVRCLFLHELGIYTIAILWKYYEYAKIKSLLERTYFSGYRGTETKTFSDIIYYEDNSKHIHTAKCKADEKQYHSALAQIFIERIGIKYTMEQLTFADTLMFNLDLLFSGFKPWYWFPITYRYGCTSRSSNLIFTRFARGFISKAKIKNYEPLLGMADIEAIKKLFSQIEELQRNTKSGYAYSGIFEKPALIIDYIKIDEIGTLN